MTTDLTHRDWLLFSQQKLIQLNAPEVTSIISYVADGGARLTLSNISEADLVKLNFLTNTDQNNNYLYLEEVTVNLGDSVTGLLIPGLQDAMLDVFRLSDLISYLADSKTHNPFSTIAFNGISVGQFVDTLTAALPTVPDTLGIPKTFTLVLNPDSIINWFCKVGCPKNSTRAPGSCDCNCNLDYIKVNGQCNKCSNDCPAGTYRVPGSCDCNCDLDYIKVNGQCNKCSNDCRAGTYRVPGSCDCKCPKACRPGTYRVANSCHCKECENGVVCPLGCNRAISYEGNCACICGKESVHEEI